MELFRYKNCLRDCEHPVVHNEDEDYKFVKKSKKYDEKAFEFLVKKYQQKIFNVCYRMLLSEQESKDASQEIFIKAYVKIKKFKGKSTFYTWLYRIAKNHCLNLIKKNKKRKEDIPLDTDQGKKLQNKELKPDELIDRKQVRKLIEEKMKELDPKCRAVIILIHYQGCTHEEAAEILGWPIGTVKVRLYRCLKILGLKLNKAKYRLEV